MAEAQSRPSPPVVAGLLVLALHVVAALVFLAGRPIAERSEDASFPKVDFPAEDLVLDPTDVPVTKGRRTPPVDLARALEPTPEALASGETLYGETCRSCHGAAGRGDGPAGTALEPPPRDFTHSEGWKNGSTVSAVFRTLFFGIAGSSMNAYDYLPAEDRFALVHHVRSLVPPPRETDSAEAVARLDEEFGLSRGLEEPSRIPVSLALERMTAEVRSAALELGVTSEQAEVRRLLERVIQDPARAAETLAAARSWRKDREALVVLVTRGAPQNGFTTAAATMTTGEWGLLQEALAAAVPAAAAATEAAAAAAARPE